MEYKFVVEIEKGIRLDKYLDEQLHSYSRSKIQKLIKDGHVYVNSKNQKSNFIVKNNDQVTVLVPQARALNLEPVEMNLDIVYEDEYVVVVNKPKGLVVHPAPGHYDYTLVHGLLHKCNNLSGINGVLRPGIVHRIDKDTSGLIIIAKTDEIHNDLAIQLQKKEVKRKYYALVHGQLQHNYGTIDAPIGRDVNDRQKMCVTEHNSKHAITHFEVIERFRAFTLVKCSLETGRTHQIRVHMQFIKHPIAGDTKYSYKKPYVEGGQLLHAYELEFFHPVKKEIIKLQAPLPFEFEEILEHLRRESE